ncbi:MAG: hypothetical protein Q9227_001764 [Pyrenula ochraceoflavens]
MSDQRLKVVFGGGPIGKGKDFTDEDTIKHLYRTLKSGGCDTIDTSRLYSDSEEWIGKTGGGVQFTIDSKTPGGFLVGSSNAKGIFEHAKESVQKLGVESVNVYYIHCPDRTLDLAEMLKGVHTAYCAGYFKKFGLSNFTACEVSQVHAHCRANGYVLPSVYQANYSAVSRRMKSELLPTLRKLDISVYAYSPLAGGLLTKSKQQLIARGRDAGRFGENHWLGNVYGDLYNKASYHTALDMWTEAAQSVGCSKAELAFRWIAFDSALDARYGDGIVFGASRVEQAEQSLKWLKMGSVGGEAKKKIEKIWKVVEEDAPLDNYNVN